MREKLAAKLKLNDGRTMSIYALSRVNIKNVSYTPGVRVTGFAPRFSALTFQSHEAALEYAASQVVIDARNEFLYVRFEGKAI
jgi:hypothetical protein